MDFFSDGPTSGLISFDAIPPVPDQIGFTFMLNVPRSLPFPVSEYRARADRVRSVLADRGIDVLLVTNPANLYYLTGYEASWYPPRLPVAVAVRADSGPSLFFDWSRHIDHVKHTTLFDEAVYYEYGESAAAIVGALTDRGLPSTLALEWSSPSPVPGVLNELADALRGAGTQVLTGDWIVDDLRLYKSPAEVDRVRRASDILDEAFSNLQQRLRPGMSELEVSALATMLLAEGGSEIPAMPPLVSSGPTAWRDVHAYPSGRRIERGELVSIDASAVVDRYHVNLSRVFSIGTPNPMASEWLDASSRSLQALMDHARHDEPPRSAMERAEEVLLSAVPRQNVWWTGGYSLGIAFPPSWVGHGYLAGDGPTDVLLRDGYVSNFESIMFSRERGFEVAAIDTVLMTRTGLVQLSTIPRELLITGTGGLS